MTSVTFFGGASEIGGNKILVEDDATKLFLDFGMSYNDRRKFYSSFLLPKDPHSLVEFGILPDLKGVYKFDDSSPAVDAVVLSHAHTDHFQCISFLNRQIKVYASKTTKKIIEAVTDTKHKSIENDLSGLTIAEFENGLPFKVGNVRIHPFEVDHSIPGSYGFILETSSGRVAYSGDLRRHGRNAKMTRNFVSKVGKTQPLALLCEGTNIQDGNRNSEMDVFKQASQIVGHTDGLVFANFSAVDIDRMRSFYRVARHTDRRLAVSPRQAHILTTLKGNSEVASLMKEETLSVFKKQKGQYEKWEKTIFSEMPVVTASDVKKEQSRWILVAGIFDLTELFEIRPNPGSVFLFSASEPFNEEMEEDLERLRNWLEHFGVPIYTVHSSGHIMPLELKSSIVQMQSRQVFTIHTSSQKLFSRFLSGAVDKVIQPTHGKKYGLEPLTTGL